MCETGAAAKGDKSQFEWGSKMASNCLPSAPSFCIIREETSTIAICQVKSLLSLKGNRWHYRVEKSSDISQVIRFQWLFLLTGNDASILGQSRLQWWRKLYLILFSGIVSEFFGTHTQHSRPYFIRGFRYTTFLFQSEYTRYTRCQLQLWPLYKIAWESFMLSKL